MRSPVAISNGWAPVLASYSAITLFTSSMSAVAGSYSRSVVSAGPRSPLVLAKALMAASSPGRGYAPLFGLGHHRHLQPLTWVGGINKHHPNHFLRILCGVQAHRESPKRVADEHIGSFRSGVGQERVQFINDSLSCSRHRVGVAPADASAIIAASAGELCHIGTD